MSKEIADPPISKCIKVKIISTSCMFYGVSYCINPVLKELVNVILHCIYLLWYIFVANYNIVKVMIPY